MHIPPYHKLDPQQQAFLDKISKSISNPDSDFHNQWIQGFAGSGKSVLLAYTAKIILQKKPQARILVIVFTRSLKEMFKADFNELGLGTMITIDTYYRFMSRSERYDYILCDEVQDLTPRVLNEIRDRCSNVIVAGDSNQSIFERDPHWKETTVCPSVIGELINGTPYELGVIHRLSQSIIDAIQCFSPQMNIFTSKIDMTKENTQIRLYEATSEEKEVEYIMEQATKAINIGDTAAILTSKAKIIEFTNQVLRSAGKPEWEVLINKQGNPNFEAMNQHLLMNGIPIQYLGNGYGYFNENNRLINIMTFHSAKGLDFENVFIPFANKSLYINLSESITKTLFMVAMTRTRKNLYITYTGAPIEILNTFESKCLRVDIPTGQPTPEVESNSWGF
ncbi:MAG: DEAD/DEAH box helicase family protein [Porphyromonas sp.]|uniref:3'-5' exonuclease n=1 Tax=Porphyromonas sp. TaxID=1924944 RepID=UPI001CAE1E63|nr:3'-5' exonuclease [Porphyromonas sp.]MBF1371352.1 DEAD/DEAH box helicase family protein [Porphyromonas sp.]